MNISLIRLIPAAVLILLGVVVIAVATFGVFRIRYVLNRMHASAMIDSLGLLLILGGLAILYGFTMPTLKLIFIVTLFWCASPVCAHLLMDLEADTSDSLHLHCEIRPLSQLYPKEKSGGEKKEKKKKKKKEEGEAK